MQMTFISPQPHQKAHATLDTVLSNGVDQLAIACAFLTPGGAQALIPHARKLLNGDSFLVVASEPPTDVRALAILHHLAPNRIYAHLGYFTPKEKKVGTGLMHSKVFLARKGEKCWLWVGSHNLTASALQGVNLEAAILVTGHSSEPIFKEALSHLHRCRDESVLFDPSDPPEQPKAFDTLIVHAECHASVRPPTWFVHLLLPSTKYDTIVRPPATVWLYLYPPQSLFRGLARPAPMQVYSGAVTAMNYTEAHPDQGISAKWDSADFFIEHEGGIFKLRTDSNRMPAATQCVFRIDSEEDVGVEWVTENPAPRSERQVGERWFSEVDRSFARFFTRDSLHKGCLVHQRFDREVKVVRLPEHQLGAVNRDSGLFVEDGVELRLKRDAGLDDVSAFLYRAKYRV